MKLQFKLAAAALAFVSVSSFATDISTADIQLATPLVTDLDSAVALHDATSGDLTFDAANAVIFQTGDGNFAVIDQTGNNFALIAQGGSQPSIALIVQTGTTSIATIVQR